MKRDRKISIFVVLLVALFTAFFLYEASFLVINGDFTRFFPWDEGSDTYYGGEEGQTPILAMEREEDEVLTDYIISQDYRTGFKAVNGIGLEEEKEELMLFLKRFVDAGICNVLCTEISRDGTLGGPAIELYRSIMDLYPTLHLIASGGVASDDDILALDRAGIPAVVFGKAFYEGRITLNPLA